MISSTLQGNVAVVTLDRGVTNAINLELIEALSETLSKARQDRAVGSLVLASANDKFFSIGFDLPHLLGLTRERFEAFFRAFNRLCISLYTLPKGTVATLTGHAVAGGCILATCCDYRFLAEGKKLMGLNEIKLGLPLPYPADCILRSIVGVRAARTILDSGDLYRPEQSLAFGLVDQVLPLGEVRAEAITQAEALAMAPGQAYSISKQNRTEPVMDQVQARLDEKERNFFECWFQDEAQQRLQKAAEKF